MNYELKIATKGGIVSAHTASGEIIVREMNKEDAEELNRYYKTFFPNKELVETSLPENASKYIAKTEKKAQRSQIIDCCICGKRFRGYGNNAEPVKDGKCCDSCNAQYVIPARLGL